MSKIHEVTRQADYIASMNHCLKTQWQTYHKTLTKAVTTSKININHRFTYSQEGDLRFLLFNYFIVRIQLGDDFYSRDICYSINLAKSHEAENFAPFAHAMLDENGNIDGEVNSHDMQAVLDHYLDKIAVIYQCLYDSLHNDHAIHDALKKITLSV
ncbi:formate hydrogenlyase regulator HycA [Serratia sp. UGAL515B_01]|uniref:formate hydrogenlyase regulator HycA n=1 Tax=Serratia sp. UGAL515B_01 TaxID=2986763 RepID=UPI002953ADE7|nr:formate hydrogenlyase regulator HycA [Serratia sp. UGAL515B_01]WON78632.1 formate hydrogenlyase regulator HycA [Serratia sp. UGAL515B_01]